MIKRLAAVTAKWLLQAGAISASDVELYEYSIYGFLFTLCPLGLVLIISMFLHMVVEGILLIIPFILIRKFCGGFHFQSPVFCGIVSTLVLTAFLFGIRLVLDTSGYGWWCAALLISVVQVVIFSPIDSEGRRLTQNEKKVFKKSPLPCQLLRSYYALCLRLSIRCGLQFLSGQG